MIGGATPANAERWRTILVDGDPRLLALRKRHRALPAPPRCKLCLAPFKGPGRLYARLRGRGPAQGNPRYCRACDGFLRAFPGGTEVDLSLIFVDLRGSVALAERSTPAHYARHMTGAVQAAVQAIDAADGFVIELRGDCVVGIYAPGFCGPHHASKAAAAASALL